MLLEEVVVFLCLASALVVSGGDLVLRGLRPLLLGDASPIGI